jgi:hypothetical protein
VRARARLPRIAAALALLGASACTPADPFPTDFGPREPGTAAAIAYEQGLTRYLGTARPLESTVSASGTTYTFDTADGPMCMRGGQYSAAVRDVAESEDLLIFMQGGGACWSAFCLAVTAAPPGIPPGDLLRDGDGNPLSGWDVLYLPYCDGSLFAGDADVDEDGDGAPDRFHRGLANLSAALTMGYQHFPAPRRVVLAGSSGGGFGTILAAFLVRYVYPDAPIFVLDDAGIGVARGDDPSFVATIIDEFGAREFIPADCAGCTEDGHITDLVDYLLDRDPNVRVAAISSWYDFVISEVFLMTTPEAFRDALASETGALHDEHPDAYRRFLYDGAAHTALLGNVTGIVGRDLSAVELPDDASLLTRIELESIETATVDGVVLRDWVAAMVEGDPAWIDLTATPGPVPMP